MKTQFIDLCSLILGCKPLEGDIGNYKDRILNKVKQYNNKFNLRGDNEFRGHDGEVLVPPVPFASTGKIVKSPLSDSIQSLTKEMQLKRS
ncbi:hypothetical protein RE628_00735 [Paenibacillus sp. D2_2]|uniref:hypothetical protein n=1 Tax=Paenibacillus sp. D2_2 TaxID=3073092 RepID=UPI002815FC7C|nr:hypothetical protein [Paenibacillus sp. D2_2]WMT41181.1 hypothetical protein RE628_00735 [Paenibacillus sp. D2_2]